jgi:hypothetical protein
MSPLIDLIGSAKGYGWGALTAGSSFESIATIVAVGGETALSFTSIPSTYKNLQIRLTYKDTYSASFSNATFRIGFNGDTANNYTTHYSEGTGSAASAGNNLPIPHIRFDRAGITAGDGSTNIFGVSIIDITDYASTTKHKTVRAISGNDTNTASTQFGINISSGLWRSTSTITTINLIKDSTAFFAGSTFSLYGIKG